MKNLPIILFSFLLMFSSFSQNSKMSDSSYVITNTGEKIHYDKVLAKGLFVDCKNIDGKSKRYDGDEIKYVITTKGDLFMYTNLVPKKVAPDKSSKLVKTKFYEVSTKKKKVKYDIIAKKGENYIVSRTTFRAYGGAPMGASPGMAGPTTGGGASRNISHYLITEDGIFKLDDLSEKKESHEEIYQKLLAVFSDCPEIMRIIENRDVFFYTIQIMNSKNKFYKQIEEAFKNYCFEE